MKKKKRFSLTQRRKIYGYLFILPWFVGFLYFYVRSIFLTGQISLSKLTMDTVNGGYKLDFVGLDNYIYAFRAHATFKQILVTSVMDILVDVPLITFFSLFMAMMLNKKFPGRTIVRAIFFLPVILHSGAITAAMELGEAMMAGGISTSGSEQLAEVSAAASAINIDYFIGLFETLGIPDRMLEYVVGAVARINDIIAVSGVQIIIFLAALQSIPASMYEVAKMEGATGYETFWKVTFPMVMPHIITNVVYTIVDSFTESEVVTLAYDTAFTKSFNYGLSSAFSLISSVVTCLILLIICSAIQKRTFYYN